MERGKAFFSVVVNGHLASSDKRGYMGAIQPHGGMAELLKRQLTAWKPPLTFRRTGLKFNI